MKIQYKNRKWRYRSAHIENDNDSRFNQIDTVTETSKSPSKITHNLIQTTKTLPNHYTCIGWN